MNEDKELVTRTISGEKEAFEMIIQRYQQPLMNYIGRMVGDRELALDFTQEVFIKTYSSLHTYQSQYKFSTWLFKIASNFIIDYWRKRKIEPLSLDYQQKWNGDFYPLQVPNGSPSLINKFELSELREKIECILKNIPAPLREVFVWRHINDLSYQEIAEITGLPVGTIKNRVYQAKEMIFKHLEKKS